MMLQKLIWPVLLLLAAFGFLLHWVRRFWEDERAAACWPVTLKASRWFGFLVAALIFGGMVLMMDGGRGGAFIAMGLPTVPIFGVLLCWAARPFIYVVVRMIP